MRGPSAIRRARAHHLGLEGVVGEDVVHDAEPLGLGSVDAIREVVELPRLGRADQAAEEPDAAVVAGEADLGERGRDRRRWPPCSAGRRPARATGRRRRRRRAGRRWSAWASPRASRRSPAAGAAGGGCAVVEAHGAARPVVAGGHALDVAAGAERAAGARSARRSRRRRRPRRRPAPGPWRRASGRDRALRRSGRFMVRTATPSSTSASRSSVPVSIFTTAFPLFVGLAIMVGAAHARQCRP